MRLVILKTPYTVHMMAQRVGLPVNQGKLTLVVGFSLPVSARPLVWPAWPLLNIEAALTDHNGRLSDSISFSGFNSPPRDITQTLSIPLMLGVPGRGIPIVVQMIAETVPGKLRR